MKTFMFHYVKPYSKYYHFDLGLFDKTIKELSLKYKIISLKEYDEMRNNNIGVSDDYIMLTFDDGTIDHYEYVYPILKKYNCSGLFFISSCIKNNKILDIQLIHKLIELYSIDDILNDLIEFLNNRNIEIDISDYNNDDKKKSIFKSLLQYKLDSKVREDAINYLTDKYNIDKDISKYYMSVNQMKEMKDNNIYFGVHTKTHPWLEYLDKDEQLLEIKDSLDYLLDNDLIIKDLITIAFPFGSFNEDTLDIVDDLKMKYGFKVNTKDYLNNHSIELIDRLDCNTLKEN